MLSTTYQVNTGNDLPLGTVLPLLGWDTNGNGEISLRSAIQAVNDYEANDPQAGPFTIDVPAGTYNLSLGELDLIPNGVAVTIVGQGSGPQATVIDAQNQSRVLEIQSGAAAASITLEDLSVNYGIAKDSGATGSANAVGGGILDNGNPLSLQDVNLFGNYAYATSSRPTALGGAIFDNGAPLTIQGGSINEDYAYSPPGEVSGPTLGGGIYDAGGTLMMSGATVEYDDATGGTTAAGGGIYVTNANAAISSSTIEVDGASAGAAPTNVAGYQAEGGGLYFAPPTANTGSAPQGSLTLQNSQITNNVVAGGAATLGNKHYVIYTGQSYNPSAPRRAGAMRPGVASMCSSPPPPGWPRRSSR